MSSPLDVMIERDRQLRELHDAMRSRRASLIASLADLEHDERIDSTDADAIVIAATDIAVLVTKCQQIHTEIRKLSRSMHGGMR